jgi:hypothetical protein
MTQCSEETTVADRISSTEAKVPTGVATIVVTISHYRSGDTSVRFEPVTYRSSDESVPSGLDAYVSPGPSEGGRSSIRRWRAPLAGGSSHEAVTGQDDGNLVRPGHRLRRTLGVLRRHGTALVVAAAAAIAAAGFMLSPVSGSRASVEPTAPTSPKAESAAMSNTKPADCSYLTASGWISGLYGLYESSAEALSALARSGQAGESLVACLRPKATTCSPGPTSTEPGGPTSPPD